MPALRVPAIDPTGAGDVFVAALMAGTLARTGRCCSGSGSPTSPPRCRCATSAARWPPRAGPTSSRLVGRPRPAAAALLRDYAFLEDVLAGVEHRMFARAVPTIGFDSGTHDHSRHGPRPGHVA